MNDSRHLATPELKELPPPLRKFERALHAQVPQVLSLLLLACCGVHDRSKPLGILHSNKTCRRPWRRQFPPSAPYVALSVNSRKIEPAWPPSAADATGSFPHLEARRRIRTVVSKPGSCKMCSCIYVPARFHLGRRGGKRQTRRRRKAPTNTEHFR